MAFSGRSLSGRLSAENEPFVIWNILLMLGVRVVVWLSSQLVQGQDLGEIQAAVHHPALRANRSAGISCMTMFAASEQPIACAFLPAAGRAEGAGRATT